MTPISITRINMKKKLLAASPMMAAAALISGCASFDPPISDPALSPKAVILEDDFAFAPNADPDISAQDKQQIANLLPMDDPAFLMLKQMAIGTDNSGTDDSGPDNSGIDNSGPQNNAPTLAAAIARIDGARSNLALAEANRKPNVAITGGANGQRQNPSQFGGAIPEGVNIDRYLTSFGSSISASWDPDILGQLRATQRAALIRIDAQRADAAAVRQILIAGIAANVIDWQTIIARENILNEDMASVKELLDLTNSRVRAGLAPASQSVQSEILLTQAQQQFAALQRERPRIIGALVTLTGKPTTDIISALDKITPLSDAALPIAITTNILRTRPDVAAAEYRLAAADADIAAIAAERFPRLTLSGSLGLIAFAFGDIFSADTIIGSLGANVAAPLFDFGRIDAEIAGGQARTKEAFANYRNAVFTALGDAEAAYGQSNITLQELAILNKQLDLQRDALRLTNIRYSRGLEDFRSVLNAQRILNNSAENRNILLGTQARSRVALWLALGGD